jgi:hypothetical protein
MTHKGHSLTTLTYGFTRPSGYDSGNFVRNARAIM